MDPIFSLPHSHPFEIGPLESSGFQRMLTEQFSQARKVILVDEHTHDHCLQFLLTAFTELEEAEVMLLPAGEENKVLEVCAQVWEAMSEYQITRHDLIINLGGGVVCDMGGFIASVYKRGVTFIHIPTSLLAMVDASIGGKTGIDYGRFKNLLGVFAQPGAVFADPRFLHTLPELELRCGFAEMLKHGLIASPAHWNDLVNKGWMNLNTDDLVKSINIKREITAADPLEQNERKKLNLGHTFGHAIEGLLLDTDTPIKHGDAVALGILAEAFIARKKNLLNPDDFQAITVGLIRWFPIPDLSSMDAAEVFESMQQDKKNDARGVLACLPTGIGRCEIDVLITEEDCSEALDWLNNISEL